MFFAALMQGVATMFKDSLVPAQELLESLSQSAVRLGRWVRGSGIPSGFVYVAFVLVMLVVLIDM